MSELTHVELMWLKKRIENWIRFGRTAEEHVLDRQRRLVSFAPGSVFAFVRWAANDYGTVVSRIDILRAVGPASATRPCPSCAPAEKACCALPAGRRSRKCCRQSTPLRRSASIRPTLRRTTGATSTTVCPSASGRGPIRGPPSSVAASAQRVAP